MAHTIEVAKSGRAGCKTCRAKIEKGELRFGEEAPNMFAAGESTFMWHHLACAAKKKPWEVETALGAYAGEVPERAAIEAAIAEAKKKVKPKPASYPYAERAATGRSHCAACEQPIDKGALRVAVEREVETGAFVTRSAAYLHAGCAAAHTGDAELLAKVKTNSLGLGPDDIAELERALGPV